MADGNEKKAVRKDDRMLTLFNVRNKTVQDNIPIVEDETPYHEQYSGTFSDAEMARLPGLQANNLPDTSIRELDGHLDGTSKNVRDKIKALKSFKALTPEIDKARSILIPSIMSPNDMQADTVAISVDPIEGVSDGTLKKLSKLLHNYFNDELRFGVKVTKWLGKAGFETGAVPVLTIPHANIRLLTETDDEELRLMKQFKTLELGVESLAQHKVRKAELEESIKKLQAGETLEGDEDVSLESLQSILNDAPEEPTVKRITVAACIAEDKDGKCIEPSFEVLDTVSMESFSETTDGFEVLMDDAVQGLEELFADELFDETLKVDDLVKISMETVKTAATRLKDKDGMIEFSTDFRGILAPSDSIRKGAKDLHKRISEQMYGGITDRLFILDDEDQLWEGDHPTMVELPSEAVVPIAVPGTPEEHIGYIVLLDKWGNPIKEDMDKQSMCSKMTVNSGAEILYNGTSGQKLSQEKKFEAASLVFGLTVKKMILDKLAGQNLEGVDLPQHQAISNILFQRLLRKQRVRIVLVPKNLISYYAFDYREDGTGKAFLEDNMFLMSLRNTLMIANVMSAIKNSMDRKRIEYDAGNSAVNHEQMMKLIVDTFVEKRMFRFDHNPLSTIRDLTKRSVTVAPKNLMGLTNFQVTTEEDGRQTAQPDTDMMDKLTEMTITKTGVPYASMNQLGENEFSRSVATTNLFFSNDVRAKQTIVTPIMEGQIRQYTQSSYSLITQIAELLANDAESSSDEAEQQMQVLIRAVINNIKVKLPTPAVAASKAQYEELEGILSLTDKLMDYIYDENLIIHDRDQVKESLLAMKAFVRQTLIRNVVTSLGNQVFDIPDFDDIDSKELADQNQRVLNISKQLKAMIASLTAGESEDGGGGGGW